MWIESWGVGEGLFQIMGSRKEMTFRVTPEKNPPTPCRAPEKIIP